MNNWILDIVEAERERSGHTIRSLAREANVNHVSLSRWINGQTDIRSQAVASILRVLGMTIVRIPKAVR